MVRMIAGIIGIFIILPLVYGGLLGEVCLNKSLLRRWYRLYVLGFMLQFTVFYALYIVMLRINRGLRTLTKSFLLVSVIALVILILMILIRHQFGEIIESKKKWVLGAIAYIRSNPLILVFLAIVIWEIIQMITFTEVAYSDDDAYSPMILDMVASDGFFGVDPETGYQSSAAYKPELKYMLTAWLPWQAFGSLICDVHPLVFTKTILPVALIIFHYMIIWELASLFINKPLDHISDGRAVMMIFYALLLELGWSSLTTTLSYYFLTWLWYGKSFVQFISIPLVLTEYVSMIRGDGKIWTYILIGAVIVIASCAASMMGVFLMGAAGPMLIIATIVYRKMIQKKEK